MKHYLSIAVQLGTVNLTMKGLRTTSTVVRALEQLVYASCSVQGSASYSERTELEHKLSAN